MSGRGRRGKRKQSGRTLAVVAVVVVVLAIGATAFFLSQSSKNGTTATQSSTISTTTTSTVKPMILYINQGNGVVNQSNFGSMLAFATSHGFNTIFFQVYREGVLLFDTQQLSSFVGEAHADGISIFFSLYFTNSSQTIPTEIYTLSENGISLDMSTLSVSSQTLLFDQLSQGYTSGLTAITTTDLTLPLSPNLLVIETYTSDIQQYAQYIHPGVVASVGVFETTSQSNYQQEVQYALQNSDGVMVFDYAGLMKSGY